MTKEILIENLTKLSTIAKERNIESLFNETSRLDNFFLSLQDLYFDFSKCQISDAELNTLIDYAKAIGIEEKRSQMFSGEAINFTEDRAVLHVALRNPKRDWIAKGEKLGDVIVKQMENASKFAQSIYDGTIKAKNGEKFSAIIHIGIGGSDLGPRVIYEALKPFKAKGPEVRFCANIEPTEFEAAINGLDPATTLVVCVSKTFTTIETLTNLKLARDWLQASIGTDDMAHLVAISAAPAKAVAAGFAAERVFGFEEWVGGRYSLWSAVGLTLEMAFGTEIVASMHAGAAAMDNHFETAPIEKNIPLIAGLIGYWNHEYLEFNTRAIIPYALRLKLLPQFLQQLDMESNGKSVNSKGEAIKISGPVVWGAEGTNAQHAFFQHLHQSPQINPVEFILITNDGLGHEASTRLTLANALAQSEALMRGKSLEEVTSQMKSSGASDEEIKLIAPHRVFSGNRPSLSIVMKELNAYNLGALLSFFEHRCFVEGKLWDINSFDQWGVELGKVIALEINNDLLNGASEKRDISSKNLIKLLQDLGV